jgi:hypothetical protein
MSFESIYQEQFIFLHERQILDAMGVAQEGMHTIKIKNMPAMVLKLDLSKSHERVSWITL